MRTLLRVLLVVPLVAGCAWLTWWGTERLSRAPSGSGPPAPVAPGADTVDASPDQPDRPAAAPEEGVFDAPARLTGVTSVKNSLAIQKLEAGDLEDAVSLFEECLEAEPEEEVFAKNLAEALARLANRLYDSGEEESRAAALDHLARAVELDPSRDRLAGLLSRWRKSAAAEEGFWTESSDHFEISFDGSRDEVMGKVQPLFDELEEAYHEFGDHFGEFPVEEGRSKIRVVMYRRDEFDAVTGLGDWAGGVFDGTVRVPVQDVAREQSRLKRVLRHELLHAFVQEMGGRKVPGWLNEGLAQWLEPPFMGSRGGSVQTARAKLAERELFPLSKLEGSLASWKDTEAIGLAYAQSLAFVDYVQRFYGDAVLFEMVTGYAEGKTAEETFEARIGVSLAVVLEDLAREL